MNTPTPQAKAVRRFALTESNGKLGRRLPMMKEQAGGKYVLFSDYEALQRENASFSAAYFKQFDNFKAQLAALEAERDEAIQKGMEHYGAKLLAQNKAQALEAENRKLREACKEALEWFPWVKLDAS